MGSAGENDLGPVETDETEITLPYVGKQGKNVPKEINKHKLYISSGRNSGILNFRRCGLFYIREFTVY